MDQIKTSIFPDDEVQMVRPNLPKVPTWGILIFLVIVFFALKTFIYLKDHKRHNR